MRFKEREMAAIAAGVLREWRLFLGVGLHTAKNKYISTHFNCPDLSASTLPRFHYVWNLLMRFTFFVLAVNVVFLLPPRLVGADFCISLNTCF